MASATRAAPLGEIETSGDLISSDKVEGTSVYNREGEQLGTIDRLMIDKQTGRVHYAIMSFGGFLGMGNSFHPLPWQSLIYERDAGRYVVDLDRERLENAPSYEDTAEPSWNDPEYGRRVSSYYGF